MKSMEVAKTVCRRASIAAEIAVALAGLAARPCPAAEPVRVAPDSVVAQALAHSPALRSAAWELRAAQAGEDAAHAAGLPSLEADAAAGRYEGLEDAQLAPTLVIPGIEPRYRAALTVRQPLYTGGELDSRQRGAACRRESAGQDRTRVAADVALQALNAYWEWSRAFYSLRTLEAALARTTAHAADLRHLFEAGLANENDALAADVLRDRTRLRLDEVRRLREVARARIARLTGADLAPDAAPEPPAAAPPAPAAEAALLAGAQSNRTERAALSWQIRAAEAEAEAARAAARPHVYATAQYEQARPNAQFFPPENRWNDDAFLGVSVGWNLLDWGLTRSRAAEAEARVEQARLRLEQLDDAIRFEVRAAAADLLNALDRIDVARRACESAERALKTATDLQKNGMARPSEVLDAHAQLTDAEYESVTARTDAVVADAALRRATGALRAGGDEAEPTR